MKRFFAILLITMLAASAAWAGALGSSARTAIPGDLQQLISVDYRALRNSPTAQALKAQVLPQNVKEFESSLRTVGIDPDKQLSQLTFVSYRSKQGVKTAGIAQGDFTPKTVLRKLRLKKIKPTQYNNSDLYPMGEGMTMSFLDDSTLLFGNASAVKGALDARDGVVPTLDSNSDMSGMIPAVESEPVWSILDAAGTQNMMHSALGQAAQVADYNTIKKRLTGSRYIMNFNNGVNFDLDVMTSDSVMAATLASLVKAGVLYKKLSASPTEKLALDSMSVDSDSSAVKLHFRTDDNKFQSLLHSDLFASVSH